MTAEQRPLAAVVAIGSELVSGRTDEAHAAWISRRLERLGIETIEHRAVGDDVEAISEALKALAARASLIVATGGLGPTADDVTREALAVWAGVPLVASAEAKRSILAWYAAKQRPPGPGIDRQAKLPRGAEPITNPAGTAPAIRFEHEGCIVYALPGVPHELRALWKESVEPELASRFSGVLPPVRRSVLCFGVPEAELDARLVPLLSADDLEIAFAVRESGTEITLTARDPERSAAERALEQACSVLGEDVVGVEGASLAQVLLQRLRTHELTIGFAESCTAGLAAHLFAQVPGASDALRGAIVAYANEVKERLLDVPLALLETHGAVSEPVARAMANGALERLEVDLAVAITGIAGPGGARPGKPVGTVHIAVAARPGLGVQTRHRRYRFGGDRVTVQRSAAWTALDQARRALLELDRRSKSAG